MKKIIIAFAFFLASTCYANTGEHLDKIVAIVNDDVVTQTEFNRSLSLAKLQAQQEGVSMNDQLKKRVLDDLINKKLQLQIAKQAGITLTEQDIDRIINNIAEKNNISVSDLYHRIATEGMSAAEYRDELREQMTIQKLQQQEVASRLMVTPDEIKNYSKGKNVWKTNNANREFDIEDILIPLSDSPAPEEIADASKRAQSVMNDISEGKKVADVTRNDLGFRKLSEIPSIFASEVAKMQVNDMAGPIRAPNGFHILRLRADRAGEKSGGGESADAGQVEQMLLQRKFQENVKHFVSKLRSQAFISTNMNS